MDTSVRCKWKRQISFRFGAGAGGFFEGDFADVEGALDVFVAFEEVFDGEELEAGVAAAVVRGVEAGFGGLLLHGFGGFFEGDVDADVGALALEDSDEVAMSSGRGRRVPFFAFGRPSNQKSHNRP